MAVLQSARRRGNSTRQEASSSAVRAEAWAGNRTDMYRLVFLNGKDKGRRVVVREPTISLGRHRDCRVQVDDEQSLDRHALLEEREDGVYVRADEQALLSVNDAVLRSTRLDHDDVLQVGATQIQYQRMAETPFYEGRRVSVLHLLSLAAVVAVLLAQVAVVARLMMGVWILEEPEPEPEPPQVQAPPPRSSEDMEVELRAARERLDRLAAQSEEQSTEEIWAGSEAARLAEERENLERSIESIEVALAELNAESAPAHTDAPEAVVPAASRERAATLLAEARALVAAGEIDEASVRLEEATQVAPSFLPARIMKARLLEQGGHYAAALEEWDNALRLAADPALTEELTGARARAARIEAQARSDAARETPRRTVERDVLPRRVRIGAMHRNRLPQRDGYDEVRIIRFGVSQDIEQGPVRPDGVYFDVRFIDRVVGGDDVFVSRVPVSAENLKVQGAWPADEEREFSVLYMVPEGFRERDAAERGVDLRFYGFLIRAYYDGILQDTKAFPGSLLDRPDASHVRP